jgi:hypothetical protein
MTGTQVPKRRLGRLERGYEFSRLHEEWMISVYALVIRSRCPGQHTQPLTDAAHGRRQSLQPACPQPAGGKAR